MVRAAAIVVPINHAPTSPWPALVSALRMTDPRFPGSVDLPALDHLDPDDHSPAAIGIRLAAQ